MAVEIWRQEDHVMLKKGLSFIACTRDEALQLATDLRDAFLTRRRVTKAEIEELRSMVATGDYSRSELANHFGRTPKMIDNLRFRNGIPAMRHVRNVDANLAKARAARGAK